jgi:hypothetical protein
MIPELVEAIAVPGYLLLQATPLKFSVVSPCKWRLSPRLNWPLLGIGPLLDYLPQPRKDNLGSDSSKLK